MAGKENARTAAEKAPLPQRLSAWIHSPAFKCTLIIAAFAFLSFAMYCAVCAPDQYDLSVGSISHETINASRDVVDEVTTEEKRQAAAAAVEPTYHFQEGVKEEVLSSLNTIFGEMRTVRQYAATLTSADQAPPDSFTDAEIDYAMGLITSLSLTRFQVTKILETSPESFEEMVSLVTTAVDNALNTTIREGQVSQSIQNIMQIVGYKLDVSLTQSIVPTVLRSCVQPNMVVEQVATELARQAARDSVEPVVYLQGQNIVREGERVTRSQLEMLRSLGLLKDNTTYDFSIYRGALLIVLLVVLSYVMSFRLLARDCFHDPRKLMVSAIVLLLGLGISVIMHIYFNAYLTPAVFAPLLLTILLGYSAGYASIIPYAILVGSLAGGNIGTYVYEIILVLLMSLSGSITSVRFMKGHASRTRLLLAGLLASLVSAVTVFAVAWMSASETFSPTDSILWAMGGAILSGALAISFQPVMESLFHLPTHSRLQEMCNPNQPLLRRLLLEAPGTYHHSIIVANLAEAAAERIGADPYLARTAGYYHDIGKLKRPMYFKENQRGDNPHDKIDPYISSAILTSHTRDGYQLALKEHMPPEVMEIILQHHGDTPVMFFYHKALQLSNGTPVDINEFRYEGPRPRTREAAIVMLADTIEAAVRSMQDPTPKAIDQFIERLVRGKLEDGQLSDSPITLRDIDEICDAFSTVLKGVFHERIEYPEVRHRVPAQPAAPSAPAVAPSAAAGTAEKAARNPAATAAAPAPQKESSAQAVAASPKDPTAPAAKEQTAPAPASPTEPAAPAVKEHAAPAPASPKESLDEASPVNTAVPEPEISGTSSGITPPKTKGEEENNEA